MYQNFNYETKCLCEKDMQQYRNAQYMKVSDCARKLEEFIESYDEVAPEYQEEAKKACFATLLRQGIVAKI